MPRRNNTAKRLNISTDPKVESQRETSKQEGVQGGQPSQQPQHRMLTSDTSMRNTSQNAAGGDTNDSRMSPPNLPQHLPALVNPIAHKPRQEQIQEVLSHRKLLLLRIRQSKSAAELRLKKPSKRSIVSILVEHEGETGKSEADAYKELTKIAVQVTKKQREEEKQPAEKRVSVSLRRGASVGKRMNAALSVLTPGASSDDVPLETSPLTAPAMTAPKKMKQSVQALAPPGKTISHDIAKKRASMKSNKVQPFRQPYQYSAPPPIMIAETPSKPAVVFPEAIALRERQNQVQAKLNILLDEQRRRMVNSEKPPEFGKEVSVLPNKFPQRRKTQWDYLLEEMRWLATDFVEERKWKASSGRVLSAAVLSHYSSLCKAAEDKDRAAAAKDKEKMVEDEKKEPEDDIIMEGTEKSVQSEPAEAPQRRRFVNPSEDDLLLVKSNAKKMAKMVADKWEYILKSGDVTFQGTIAAKNEGRLSSGASPVNVSGNTPEISEQCLPSIVISPEAENGVTSLSHDAIGKKVDALLDRIERRPRQRTRSKQASSKSKYTLSPVEQKASDFIEFVWKANFPAGAILGDAYSFSPYDVASSLLKQHRGTHLVLCPPARVLRWMSEFKRVNNKAKVRLLTGDSRGRIEDLSETDIVVGELSSGILSNHLHFSKFETIVLDGYITLGTSKNVSGKTVRERIHTELLSEKWWSSFLRSLSSKTQRRLFIVNSYMVEGCENDQSLLRHLTERERLGLIAGMTAFVLGPWLFHGPRKHPTHRVLSWARYHVNKEQPKNGTKIEQIESHLVGMLAKMTFAPEMHFDNVQHSFEEKSIFDTEVHLCKMSPLQQAAYDRCCRNVRGALSLGGSLLDAAKGFIQLRDVCFHARLREACTTSTANSSQPDLQRAIDIINESTKLKELIILLHRDFGVHFSGISRLEQVIPELQPKSRRSSKPTKDEVPKIAIVASSPFVQHLTSVLLSSLGVDHENMAGRRSFRTLSDISLAPIDGPKEPLRSLRESIPWIEKQLSLLRYGNDDVDPLGFPYPTVDELVTPRAANIVLGSPTELAQNETDLSLEASDAIIFLDEDWSGKECRLVKRILVRCFLHRARYESEKADFRAYRFVCNDCCEERLLCGFKDNDNTEGLYQEKWATNPAGLLELEEAVDTKDESFDHFDPDYVFEFPVRNLVSFEDEDLASFLRTKEPLPANLESGKELKFLPFVKVSATHGGIERETILAFAEELMAEEIALRTEARALGIAFYSDMSSMPPFVSTQDLFVATTRLYLESFASSDGDEQVSPSNTYSRFHANSNYLSCDASVTQRDVVEHTILSEGSTTSSEEVSSSILFYCAGEGERLNKKRKHKDVTSNPVDALSTQTRVLARYNAFSKAYTLSAAEGPVSARDGTQGLEPLVYFPPIFPALRQISIEARKDLSDLLLRNKNSRFMDTKGGASAEALKRPLDGAESAVDEKRQRLETVVPTNMDTTEVAASKIELPQQAPLATSIGKPQHVKTLGRLQNVGVANSTFEISSDEALFDNAKNLLLALDEDFGIVGSGAIPFHSQSLSEALKESVELNEYSVHTIDTTEPSTASSALSCDFEEAESAAASRTEPAMDAIILFVARKVPSSTRSHFPPSPAFTIHTQIAPWNATSAAVPHNRGPGFNGVTGELKSNGAVGVKKMKKSVTPTSFASATGQQIGPAVPFAPTTSQSATGLATATTVNPTKGKDAVRHKILAMYGKQGYGGPGLFEASKFRIAAIRVRDRISERVSSNIGRTGAFSGRQKPLHQNRSLPNHIHTRLAQDWTSLVSAAGNSGDANSLSEPTTSADFGPFWVGSLPTGDLVTKIPHHKEAMGLGLPRGVTIPDFPLYPGKSWTLAEDKSLHMLASRFAMNWYLVAGSLRDANNKLSRSPRQCCQRWHLLAKANPAIYYEMLENRRIDRFYQGRKAKETSVVYTRKVQGGDTMNINEDDQVHVPNLLRPKGAILETYLVPEPVTRTPMDIPSPELKTRRSFSIFRAASLKKHEVAISIPGVAAGQKPSLSTPHPSHQQSLQAAVAVQSTGARTEMWPLQILDLADKQKKATVASTSTSRSPISHHASTGSYQATQSRHAPVQQYPPQPNPAAHKVGIPPKPQSSSGK